MPLIHCFGWKLFENKANIAERKTKLHTAHSNCVQCAACYVWLNLTNLHPELQASVQYEQGQEQKEHKKHKQKEQDGFT